MELSYLTRYDKMDDVLKKRSFCFLSNIHILTQYLSYKLFYNGQRKISLELISYPLFLDCVL